MFRIVPILGLAALLLAGCQPTVRPSAAPAPASASRPAPEAVRLPADDAPHNDLTEWWYYTGHLWTDDGRRFGFEFVMFQSIRGDNPVGRLAHFAITDPERGRFQYAVQGEAARSVPSTLDLDIGGWTLAGGGGRDHLAASMDDYGLVLSLRSQKPAALHHDGYISFGPAGDSYYYSRTRMDVSGRLRDGDDWLPVTGQAWFDHQWGDFVVASITGWDWYSLQLGDGSEMMLFVLRDPDGTRMGAFGTYVDPAGGTLELTPEMVTAEPVGTWISPHTGGVYPSGWRVQVAAQPESNLPAMQLQLSPILLDQELAFDHMPYWEGAASIDGTANDLPIGGEAYVELTGYGW